MPKWKVKDTVSGQTWEMEWPTPPSQADVAAEWQKRQGTVDARKVGSAAEPAEPKAWYDRGPRVSGGGPSLGEAAATIGTGGLVPAVSQGYQMLRHPVENLPAWGATGMALASGGTSLPITALLTALGAGGGEAYKQLIKRGLGETDVPATSGEAAGQIGQEGIINGVLAALGMGAPRVAKGVGNWFGRSAMKTPVSILEDVPGHRTLGDEGASRVLVEKAYDKGLRPGTGSAARQARVGPGGIDELNANAQGQLRAAGAAGVRHNVGTEVAPVFRELRTGFEQQPFPEEALGAVTSKYGELLRNPKTSEPIPGSLTNARRFRRDLTPEEMNRLKIGGYAKVRDTEWGQRSSPPVQTEKAVAGRMAQALRTRVPGLAETLDDEAMMIPLEDALQRAAWRGGNREVIPFKAAMRPDIKSFMGMLADRPGTWGTLGYLLDRFGRAGAKLPPGAQVGILELLKTAAGNKMMPPEDQE